ncbi:WD40 repeat-like protein [Ramaria rubella]|nr:WD40 repeat-like protein [Ramaria rubella]
MSTPVSRDNFVHAFRNEVTAARTITKPPADEHIMSLAATTETSLTIIDSGSLKRNATSYDFQRTPTPTALKAHAWSLDNNTLYLASSNAIYSFLPTSSAFATLYKSPQGTLLQPVLVPKDKSTLIFAQGSAIHLLTIGSSPPKIANTLIGHSTPVTSLALSNDASLLASSSGSGTLCVHNLAHNSLTVLKGLPSTTGITSKTLICVFHPHSRTRLLVGNGKTLVVYDITRPSSPVKSISLSERDNSGTIPNIGHVVAISCSPFSKTLTAVAFSSGFVALVDLEKDRPFFKNLQLKVPVTSMLFTADGSSIALGTENGKVIIQDLRAMERDHRPLPVGDEGRGERIIGLCIQRRIKHTSTTPSSTTIKTTAGSVKLPSSSSAPLSQYDLNHGKSPTRRVVSSSPSTKARKFATPMKVRTMKQDPHPPKLCLVLAFSAEFLP